MASYLLLESQEPFESAEVPHHYQLAAGLKAQGNQVTLYLLQNGVLAARRSVQSEALSRLASSGVEILADDFSLRERGIPSSRLVSGVSVSSIDAVVDQLAEGRKALWL
jgi:predicted peroxiredoxin